VVTVLAQAHGQVRDLARELAQLGIGGLELGAVAGERGIVLLRGDRRGNQRGESGREQCLGETHDSTSSIRCVASRHPCFAIAC